jgi:dolichol-phosphate mannosyltransferase/undecaprenyl-phosphate 4-deoxy-4-formamido-L-arabinose transferase
MTSATLSTTDAPLAATRVSTPGEQDDAFARISVVIPVYRSGRWLGDLARAIGDALRPQCREYEIIFVDDCSPDDSWDIVAALAEADPKVKGLHLMYNEGQTRATLCGLAHASGDVVITMDDDFQHPPDEIQKLLAALREHPELDCVLGCFEEKHHVFYRNLASRLVHKINERAFRLPPGVTSSGFRALRRPVVDAILAHRSLNPALPVLIFGSTRRVMNVPVKHAVRRGGRSNYTLAKQFRLAFDDICNATLAPLRAVSAVGLAACGLSFLLGVFYAVEYLRGNIGQPGFVTIVLLLIFFSGTILLALGIIGEYLARVLREVSRRPLYVVRSSAGTFGLPGAGQPKC